MTSTSKSTERERLVRLHAFLARDPDNARLLADTAQSAFDAGDVGEARELLHRLAVLGPLTPEAVNLAGLVAIAERRFEDAVSLLRTIVDEVGGEPGPRFNLAWAHAMFGDHQRAAKLLDSAVVAAVPRAASLKIQMLHHLGRYDEALALGVEWTPGRERDEKLMGSLAMLALDAEDVALARFYAGRAPHDGQGLAALGTLALGDDDAVGAGHLFDAALEREPDNPRAWMGRGLALLAERRVAEALPAIDHGAGLFANHIGSWIASGWAHYAAGDTQAARQRFERAYAIDPNFGETQGALAVLDIADGAIEEGRRRAQVALRLDRAGFGGQLAMLLLLQQAGDASGAERIRQRALATPIGTTGKTIGQALAGLALRRS